MTMSGNASFEEYCLICVNYSSQSLEAIDKRKLWEAMEAVASYTLCTPTEIDFRTEAVSKLRRPWKYSERAKKRLFDEFYNSSLRSLSLYSKQKNDYYVNPPLMIYVSKMLNDWPGSLIEVQCRLSQISEKTSVVDWCNRVTQELEEVVRIDYGFVHFMKSKKYPVLYFRGLNSSPHLTKKEEKDNEAWDKVGYKFRYLLRGVYSGNILSETHWRSSKKVKLKLIEELRSECGAIVNEISDRIVFVLAPESVVDMELPFALKLEYIEKTLRILQRNGVEVMSV